MRPGVWWSGLSRPRRVFAGAVMAVVLAVVGVVAVRLAIGPSGPPTPAGLPSQATPGTVLLVPGYGGNTAALTTLADRLRATGRVANIVTLPGDGTGDLLAQVDTLNTAVNNALAGGAASVDVVGYSAGGLVTRLWVARDAGEHRARRIVTLGAPLHGTQLAAAGTSLLPGACPLACQQLVPGSALLRGVDAQALPAALPWLSVWTQDDQTVTPPESARLAGALNVPVQQICPGVQVSHSELPSNPLVAGIVLAALNNPRMSAPLPAQCQTLTADGRASS